MDDVTTEPPGGSARCLLGPGDPPACEVLNPRGASSAVLLCDHASNRVPARLNGLGLEADDLARHIAWDIGAAGVTRLLSARLDAPAVLSGYSRLVIDCNRRPGAAQSIPASSDGTPVPGNRGLEPHHRAQREAACFRPYHDACAALLGAAAARGQAPAVVAVHSFTPALDGVTRPWHIGLSWDGDGRLALSMLDRLRRRGDLCVGENEPYDASSPHGYTLRAHAVDHDRAHVQIEIRQDLVAGEAGIARFADILAHCLVELLPRPAGSRRGG